MGVVPPAAFLLATICLLIGAAAGGQAAIRYVVTNNVTGEASRFFNNEFGVTSTKELMSNATSVAWRVLGITHPTDTNPYNLVTLSITSNLKAYGLTSGSRVKIDMEHIMKTHRTTSSRRQWFIAVVYHEMTHVWEKYWPPRSREDPKWDKVRRIWEGAAEYVTMEANHTMPSCIGWRPHPGHRWWTGYCVTAHFFKYMNGRQKNFVADLTREIVRHGFSESYFVKLTNRTADQLWQDFKGTFPPPRPPPAAAAPGDTLLPTERHTRVLV